MESLKGPFKDIIPVLTAMKKSAGYKYNNIKQYYELDNFLYRQGIVKITKEIFQVAIINEKDESLKKQRYCCLENLNAVLNMLGIIEIPMHKIYFESKEKFIARILTKQEIKLLFERIDSNSKKENGKIKILYPVLFRLLYSNGLRINEALSLEKRDYDIKKGVLLIRESKNNITRNVVLSKTMKNIFDVYYKDIMLNNANKVFDISYSKVHNFFQKNIIELSLEPCRIHDLRHVYAVYVLDKLLKTFEEQKAIYMLSISMGHSSIESTAYYLHLTQEHIKDMQEKSKKLNSYIFPEVKEK